MPTESANVASTAWVKERERKGVGGEDKKERAHVVSKTGKYWCVLYSSSWPEKHDSPDDIQYNSGCG